MLAIHITFLLCPLIAIIMLLMNLDTLKQSWAVGWLGTYFFMNFMVILYYFAIMMNLVRGMIFFHRERKSKGKIGDTTNKEEEDGGKAVTYFNMWRGYGEGPIRIGT